jgi:predicted methyltransferase
MSAPPVYQIIGANYNRHRAADPQIARELVRLLALAPHSVVADVGAGTGNYSNALAEDLPLEGSVDAVMYACNTPLPLDRTGVSSVSPRLSLWARCHSDNRPTH